MDEAPALDAILNGRPGRRLCLVLVEGLEEVGRCGLGLGFEAMVDLVTLLVRIGGAEVRDPPLFL